MSTLDAGFFFVEHRNVPMHLGSLAVFDGPAPCPGDLADRYAARLAQVPRCHQVVKTAPLQVFRPAWTDDERFDLGRHLRHAAVPGPGGARQLQRLAERIFAEPLDRTRPLWEAWFLAGLAGGRWAILSKMHHCMVDGIGGTDLMAWLLDFPPGAAEPAPGRWQPRQGPPGISAMASGLRDTITRPLRQLAQAPGFARQRLRTRADLLQFSRGLGGGARRLAVPSASSLNGPVGPGRRWVWTTASFSHVKRIRAAHGGTVNDVLLAAITSGFRDLLAERGELAAAVVVRSLVPVSVRGEDERGMLTNRLSAVLANLPVAEPCPVRRLALLREQLSELKATHQAAGAEFLTELLGFAAPAVFALATHAAFQLPQPLVQTVTTNVPGPRSPLFMLGRPMVRAYPYVPIGGNVRISIAVFSYRGRLTFGITADDSAAAALPVLTRGIRRGLADLLPAPPAA